MAVVKFSTFKRRTTSYLGFPEFVDVFPYPTNKGYGSQYQGSYFHHEKDSVCASGGLGYEAGRIQFINSILVTG